MEAPARKVVLDYELQHKLGSGSFARVYKGVHIVDGSVVAVKVVARDKLTEKLQANLASEIRILKHLRHPNIVALYTFQKRSSTICLILEYCDGGDLHRFIRDQPTGRLEEPTARHFLRHLAAGLKFLWEQNLIHRDIKPQNLLLSDKSGRPTLKIADFGFARYIGPNILAATLCGTPLYMAPEVLENKEYDSKADIWSVGCVYFEMLVGKPPFTGANHIELLRNIRTRRLQVPEDVNIAGDSVDVLRLLLNRSPATRGSFTQFLSHPVLGEATAAARDPRPTPNLGRIEQASASFNEAVRMGIGTPRGPSAGAKGTMKTDAKPAQVPPEAASPLAHVPPSPKQPSTPTMPRRELEHKATPTAVDPKYLGGIPHVDVSSPTSVHPRAMPHPHAQQASPHHPQHQHPHAVADASANPSPRAPAGHGRGRSPVTHTSNSDDFVVIETPRSLTADGLQQRPSTRSNSSASASPTPSGPTGAASHASGVSGHSNSSVERSTDVARVANGLPFVEVYAQFAFAVAGVGDSRVIRYLGDSHDSLLGSMMDVQGSAGSAGGGQAPRKLLVDALTLYKKALGMLKHCVSQVRRHLYSFSSLQATSRASVSEQQRANGLLPWLMESMQNILERADECKRRLNKPRPPGSTPSSVGSVESLDVHAAAGGGGASPRGPQASQAKTSAEEMMYEYASQLVQDGSAKELLGQIGNAHAQLVRAQILLDALQLEGEAGMTPRDAEQLRVYAQRLRSKIQGLEATHPSLPPSGSLIGRLVA